MKGQWEFDYGGKKSSSPLCDFECACLVDWVVASVPFLVCVIPCVNVGKCILAQGSVFIALV